MNLLGSNHDKANKAMKKHDDNMCFRYGMTGHQIRTCREPKYFVDLYQTSLKGKGKHVETYTIESALALTTTEVNTALVKKDPITLVEVQSLKLSDFLKNPDGQNKASNWWMTTQTYFSKAFYVSPDFSYVIPLDAYIPKDDVVIK